jgi:hypothetical protein
MKIRQGFVSNSSATSFCIYGYSFDDGEEYGRYYEIFRKANLPFVETYGGDDDDIIGVGTVETDIDHNMNEDEDWRDYKCSDPSELDMSLLDKCAAENNLPKPQMFERTFFN